MADAECPECPGVALSPRAPNHAMQTCPCCSSRFHLGKWVHVGSHNDYGTYLCDRSRRVMDRGELPA